MLYVAIFFSGILSANGYDLVVTMEVAETRAKIFDLTLSANYPDSYELISQASRNEADSTYCFKGLPDERILVMYMIGEDTWGDEVPEPVDSITLSLPASILPNVLAEVVVTGDNRYLTGEKAVYVPTQKEKKISADGLSLLRNMAIATLRVSPMDNSVKTTSGEAVATFIDYLPASATDVDNIRTADVVRVEVFDAPDDPRFGGARHVVNFVMVKYEYGGYTKANAIQRFVFNTGNYNGYSKLAYKKMTYDAGIGYDYSNTGHNSSHTENLYDFETEEVAYERTSGDSRVKNNNASGFLRAVYQSGSSVLSNTLSVSSYKMPVSYSSSQEVFSSPAYGSCTSSTWFDYSNTSCAWKGDYHFFLPKGYALVITPGGSFANFKRNYLYTADAAATVSNISHEKAWRVNMNASLRKAIGKQSVSLGVESDFQGNDVEYTGTSPAYVDSRVCVGMMTLEANLKFGRFTIGPQVRLGVVGQSFSGGLKSTEFSPTYFVYVNYFINEKNSLNLRSWRSTNTVAVSNKSPNFQSQNQIEAIKGNPDLKMSIYNHVILDYLCFPLRNLSLAAFVGFNRWSKMIGYAYEPMDFDSRRLMVRTSVNDGFRNTLRYGVSASLYMFGNSLALSGVLDGSTLSQHGILPYCGTMLNYSFQATYSVSNVYVSANYYSGGKNVGSYYIEDTPCYYGFAVGWGNGNFNVSGKALCPFNSSYESVSQTVNTSNYASRRQQYSSSYHRSFEISVTYSFSYGKKVNRTSESADISGVQSGMLK